MRRQTSVQVPVAHLVGPGKLRVVNGRLAFSAPGQSPLRLDTARLKTVYCYGGVSISDEALRMLLAAGVEFALFSAGGNRCRGRLVGQNDSATWLRIQQYRVLNAPEHCLALAREAVAGKLESMCQAARHYQRQGQRAAGAVLKPLNKLAEQASRARTLDQLRGFEGTASAVWLDLLGKLLRAPWTLPGRRRRPPTDPVNALLSLGYTLLLQRVVAKIRAVGLEVNLGALHQYHPGRPSLACDLMEPWRTPAVDRWVLRICNTGELSPTDFQPANPTNGVRLRQERFGWALASWEEQGTRIELDRGVQATVDEFCRRIRQRARGLPDPSATL